MREERKKDAQKVPEHIRGKEIPYKLQGKFPEIETKLDELLEFVYQNRSVRIGKACSRFRVDRRRMEEWGRILEESGLIEVHYPVFGQPVFRVPSKRPKRKEKRKAKKKSGRPRIKMTPKRIIINIELSVLGLLLIYIFLVNRTLSENLLPTVISYLGWVSSDLRVLALIVVVPAVPVLLMWLRKRGAKRVKSKKKTHHASLIMRVFGKIKPAGSRKPGRKASGKRERRRGNRR